MRIAILGTRGIPASYGGFETFAEHLSTRLVARGHEVTVYCRAHYVSPRQLEYHGVRVVEARRNARGRSEEHTSELQSQSNLVCRLLLEKKKTHNINAPGSSGFFTHSCLLLASRLSTSFFRCSTRLCIWSH